MLSNEQELNKYTNKTRVKAGIFEKKKVKARDLIIYISSQYPVEFNNGVKMLEDFDMKQYTIFIKSLSILSETQKKWLTNLIPFRRGKILDWVGRGEE